MDLNDAKHQKMYGPVPAGSSVKVRMELIPCSKPHPKDERIFVTNRGQYMLSCKFTVVAGTYEDVSWRELWMLPAEMQPKGVELTTGHLKGCTITATKMRAILEAVRGVRPNDTSTEARAARNFKTIGDFDGMEFPTKVGIDKGHEYNGRMYYNNTVATIITPDKADYADIKAGGEKINPNGDTGRQQEAAQSGSYDGYDDGYDTAPAMPSEMEDVPF